MKATPTALMIVHSTMVMAPRMMPLVAPLTDSGSMSPPTSWKPPQIGGSTVCMAMANAAMHDDVADQHEPAGEPADGVARQAA